MKLLVLILCLLALHFLNAPRKKLSQVFSAYAYLWINVFGKLKWFNTVAGPLLFAAVLDIAVYFSTLIPLLSFIVAIVLLLVCLSVTHEFCPRFVSFSVASQASNDTDLSTLPSELWQVNYRYVTPLFWYLFLGSTGLIFYTCLLYAAFCPTMPMWRDSAHKAFEIAAWLPSRITGLAYALAGNGKATMKIWGELLMADYRANHAFLQSCATTAYQAKEGVSDTIGYKKLLRDVGILLLGLFAIIAMLTHSLF